MNSRIEKKNLSIVGKAYSRTPYIGYNLESPKYLNTDCSKTYIALSNLNSENSYVEILIYDYVENEFEIGYFYQHVFSPIGGVHWMPRRDANLEDNILGTASDSIRLFKEGKLLCDLRLNDMELNNMRIENIYNSCLTRITSFSFSQYNQTDIISTTIDGRCILWNIDYPNIARTLEMNIFEDILSEYKSRSILNISQIREYSLVDVCFGYSKDNILLAVNNGLAVSLDLRSPFKQSSSLVIDCIHGWDTLPDRSYLPVKICNIENTNYFSRSVLSQNITEIFDIRKVCGPLFKINTNQSNHSIHEFNNSSSNSIISVQNCNSGELLISHQNGIIQRFNVNKDNMDNIHIYDTHNYTYSFTMLNTPKNTDNFLGISTIDIKDQPGIKVIEFLNDI